MSLTITHTKTNTIPDWDQQKLDTAISAGLYPPGTRLADIVLPSDWNHSHDITDFAGGIADTTHAATAKTTLVDADEIAGTNSADGYSLIRTTMANIWTYIKSKADAVYFSVNGGTLAGTGGSGFIGFTRQSSPPATPAAGGGYVQSCDTSDRPTFKIPSASTLTIDFSGYTSNRVVTYPDNAGTVDLLLYSNTYANVRSLTNASYPAGAKCFASDLGVNGSNWYNNAAQTEWVPRSPIVLHLSKYSFGKAPSGTIGTGSSGQLTLGTAASRSFSSDGVMLYLPSIATTPAITAGWYYCVGSSTTSFTIYDTTWSGSTPTIGSAINFTVGANYTGVTTQITVPAYTLPAYAMGDYGAIKLDAMVSVTSNANSKSTYTSWGGSLYGGSSLASQSGNEIHATIKNHGYANQLVSGSILGTGNAAPQTPAKNTRANVDISVALLTGMTATDWWCVESMKITMER